MEYDGENLLEVITLGDLGPYSVTSFGIDQQNELYICSFDGKIYKFVQTYSTVDHDDLTLNKFSLYHNYPNPFNPVTWINYNLPLQANVTIRIYDMLGGQVRTLINQPQNVGYKSVIWDATNDAGSGVSAGIYLYMIQAEGFMQTKKMVLLK